MLTTPAYAQAAAGAAAPGGAAAFFIQMMPLVLIFIILGVSYLGRCGNPPFLMVVNAARKRELCMPIFLAKAHK